MNADGARVAWELLGAPAWPPAAGKAGPAGPCWQRVGPLPLSPGWILQRTWPALYRELTDRYGERW